MTETLHAVVNAHLRKERRLEHCGRQANRLTADASRFQAQPCGRSGTALDPFCHANKLRRFEPERAFSRSREQGGVLPARFGGRIAGQEQIESKNLFAAIERLGNGHTGRTLVIGAFAGVLVALNQTPTAFNPLLNSKR